MDYSRYSLPDTMTASYYVDTGRLDAENDLIDPRLESSSTPPHTFDPWGIPDQIQRFLTEQGKKSYFTVPPNLDAMLVDNYSRQVDVVHPLPTPAGARHGSPFSNQPSDTTCTTAVSPRVDSDIYYEHSPPTPPDMAAMFSYPTHFPYGMEGSLAQEQQLAGLITLPERPYVNMVEVNPSQESQPSFDENTKPQFESPFRAFSLSSEESHYDSIQPTKHEHLHIPRQMSPDDFDVPKDEIRIPSPQQANTYPSLASEDELHSEEEFEGAARVKDEDDGDYSPGKRQKRNISSTNRAPKGRKRASNASVSSIKRPRINGEPKIGIEAVTVTAAIPNRKGSFPCSECSSVFHDAVGLDKHFKTAHTRPFVCVFNFAGCTSTFASKNEWKRHATTQHLILNYWICQQDGCAKVSNEPTSTNAGGIVKASTPSSSHNKKSKSHAHNHAHDTNALPNGAIFNRKDLFTQHVKRMHIPPQVKKQVKQKKTVPEWEEHIKKLQEQCFRVRCELPKHMECPGLGGRCGAQFTGTNAWDERMEHVAKHLEKAASRTEEMVVFGGDEDPTLTRWAVSPEVAVVKKDGRGRWVMHNPLKPVGSANTGAAVQKGKDRAKHQSWVEDAVEKEIVVETSEEDAEGEEVYE